MSDPISANLATLSDTRRELSRVYREARTGQISSQEASRYTYILRVLSELVTAESLETRLEALETEYIKVDNNGTESSTVQQETRPTSGEKE